MTTGITVLIPSYNAGDYLREALESVFSQTYRNWKIILIDDASTDNSLSKAEEFLEDSRIKLIRNEINLGQSKSLNKGLEFVDTPYVITLDSDDWFYPYTLEVLLGEATKLGENIGLIHGNLTAVFQDDDGRVIKEISKKGHKIKNPYHFILSYTGICPRFYRTKALKEIGGFPTNDPYEGRYIEDLPVLLRLIEKNQFHFVDKPLYKYRQHTNMQTNNRKFVTEKMKWVIRDALKRWGDHYEPVFETIDDGWIRVSHFISKN